MIGVIRMKYEWRKQAKEIYLPKAEPMVADIGEYAYFTLAGRGDPNSEAFAEAISVLYSLSYAVKMLPKRDAVPEGYFEYSVFPLEGVWDLADKSKAGEPLDKNNLVYTIMIRQPGFVSDELAAQVINFVAAKKPHALLKDVKFERIADGLCVQMLHLGSYDSEPDTFTVMQRYCDDHGYTRAERSHKEIYLNNAKKTPADKLKTTLRFSVRKK